MNLIGKIINDCYIIREEIREDSISSYVFGHSIFSTKKFILRIFKQNKIDSNKKKLSLIKEYISTKLIREEKISNFLEIDEFEGNIFITAEVNEGKLLSCFPSKDETHGIEDIKKIFYDITDIIGKFHKNRLSPGFFSNNDFWIESVNDKITNINFINFQNQILSKYYEIKEINNIKKFLFLDENKKIISEQKNDYILIGILFYKILTNNAELNKYPDYNQLDSSIIDFKNKSKYIKIILKLFDKNKGYKSIKDLQKDLDNLENKEKNQKNKKENEKQEEEKYKDIFEERRIYFEKLEQERKKRFHQSKSNTEYILKEKKYQNEKNSEEYDKNLFSERKNYFESHEAERWNYLTNSKKDNSKHIDNLIGYTKKYYADLVTNKHNIQKKPVPVKEYFEKISMQMKKYADKIKNDNMKYFEKIIKKNTKLTNIKLTMDDLKYANAGISETRKHFNELTARSKEFFFYLAEEAKNSINIKSDYLYDIKKNKINDFIDNTLDYYNKIELDANKYFNRIIKETKRIPKKKNIKQIKSKGIDIISIKTIEKRGFSLFNFLKLLFIKFNYFLKKRFFKIL